MKRILKCIVGFWTVLVSSIVTASPKRRPPDVARMKVVADSYLEAGPFDPRWDQGGVDIDAARAGKPGGSPGNVFLAIGSKGDRTISIRRDGAIAPLVPNDWLLVASIGDVDDAQPASSLVISAFVDGHYIVVREHERKSGSTFCVDRAIGAQLYLPEGSRQSKVDPATVKAIFEVAVQRVSERGICTRYEEKDGAFRPRHFLEDGRALPKLDAMAKRLFIVPIAPFADLLKG